MKKEYIKPDIFVQELIVEGVIATSAPEVTNKPVIPFTNKYQGGWRHEEWTKIN